MFSDINELNLPKTCNTEFPDPDDLLNFKLIICPDEVRTLSIFEFAFNLSKLLCMFENIFYIKSRNIKSTYHITELIVLSYR